MRYILLLLFLYIGINSKAQLCINSFSISPTYVCPDPTFDPVCGCDGKTYRNYCEAHFKHGVQRYTSGSCSGFEFDIRPNITSDYLYFTLVETNNPTFIKCVIIDSFGKLMELKNITVISPYYETLDVSNLLQGVYFIFVYDSKNNYRYKKFVKFNG